MDKDPRKPADVEAFRARWTAFMEGGWETLLVEEAETVEAVRRRAFAILPTHPKAMSLGDLLVQVAGTVEGAKGPHLLAALLEMERHGHACLVAGWIFRPPPRVPRRGLCVEDMYFKFGCEDVSPDQELTPADPGDTLSTVMMPALK
ncbi:MAG TPA: hypothetical protein VL283_02910 [Candidatus Baltobacteraceae bacterium]|nr:hypothetical protein [Candidatus Baltobacteraceae bacterium]